MIVGQNEAIDLALVTLLAGGHALIEGVPGVGKTLLAKALARAVGGEFQRIQFTPDLMPADITGTSVFDLKTQEFRLVRGPIFTNFLLARRNQSGTGENAIGSAGSHARAAGDDRSRDLRAAAGIRGVRNAKPDRASGHVSASGGAEGPLSRKNSHGLSGAGRRKRTGAAGGGRRSAGAPSGRGTARASFAAGRTRSVARGDGARARQRGA